MTNLVIADFKTGFENGIEPFLLSNDSFPVLNNCFLFRRRVLKKRGNKLLNRLRRDLENQALGNTDGAGNFSGNIKSILSLETNSAIVPGSIEITVGAQVFTEPATPDGTLTNGGAGTGTINYASMALTLDTDPNLAATPITITFSYYPALPVMGLEDFDDNQTSFPTLVAFDTKYSYQINQSTDEFYDVTFYKSTQVAFTWSGNDYQQFYSTNYEDALWVTNNKPGFHFRLIENVVAAANSTFTITGHGLSNNDYVFINEVNGVTGVNGVSGRVTVVDPNNFTIPTPGAAGAYINGGIAQYMTRSTSNSIDGIRWYDGDPTLVAPPDNKGWVNFAPPLSNVLQPEYLVGAKIVVPFKDRLLFFGVWKQTSSTGAIFFPNLMVYSQNGTPYYSQPVPQNLTFDFQAWFQNVAAKGGFLRAPVDQDVITVEDNEDVLICGFEESKRKVIYTGDDSFPFFYQTINDELGTSCTFSSITLDQGVIDIGPYGIPFTSSTSSQRIDLQIPDEVFQISPLNNGNERVTAFRDYRNEFCYFTFVPKQRASDEFFFFPNKTLLYNYRDNNWATFDENYTHYGFYRKSTSYTWATLPFRTWASWTNPWNYGGLDERFPNVIGGNQQGFVMITDVGTANDKSQQITAISGIIITSPDHCLSVGDFIQISDPISPTSIIDGFIAKVVNVLSQNAFTIDILYTGTYVGGGSYRRIQNFEIRTKMFPTSWSAGRLTRIGLQRYLFDNAPGGQIVVNLYMSQTQSVDSNTSNISTYLPYTNILGLGPETEFPNQENQDRIWHRMQNGFIGDTVQVGFTMSEAQLRNLDSNEAQIALHAIVLTLYPAGII